MDFRRRLGDGKDALRLRTKSEKKSEKKIVKTGAMKRKVASVKVQGAHTLRARVVRPITLPIS